jgi:hypothetical protein
VTYVERVGAVLVGVDGGLLEEVRAFGFVFGPFGPARRAFEEDLSECLPLVRYEP